MNVKISVIIPTYNREDKILRAIKSVFNQTYINWEIIIVDDGSEDNTKEILKPYLSEKVKYFFQKNAWVSSARNFGISKATWEYITLLDSDDEFLPKKLETQLKEMCKYKINFSISNSLVYRDNKEFKKDYGKNFLFNKEDIFSNKIEISSFFMFSKNVFGKVKFNEKLIIWEDANFIFNVLNNFDNKWLFINEFLVKRYKELDWNRISTNFVHKINGTKEIIEIYKKDEYKLWKIKIEKKLSHLYLHLWIFQILNGDSNVWRKNIIEGIKYNKYSIKNIFYFIFFLFTYSKVLVKIIFYLYKKIWKFL